MKKILFAALVMAVAASNASAAGGCSSPFCAGQPGQYPNEGIVSYMFNNRPVPTFQAAPWYLYWPYNAHFMTPAPLGAPFVPPPGVGGAMMNPYFPSHAPHGYGYPGQ